MVMKQVKRAGGLLVASGIIFEDAPTRIPMEARKVGILPFRSILMLNLCILELDLLDKVHLEII